MSTSKSPKDTPPQRSTVILLLSDIGSTTWRMFLPTIGLALLGQIGDSMTGFTAPWLMLTGAFVGACLAGLLIKKQLTGINE